MQISLGDHPSEETLERYLLHQTNSSELDAIETHVLACPDCVQRLEEVESYISVMRASLREMQAAESPLVRVTSILKGIAVWLTPLRLSWTAAAAVVIAALMIAPAQFALRWPVAPARVNLSAWRGAETTSVPAKRPLNIKLDSVDLPDGAVAVQLVDAVGHEVSHGSATINQETTEVALPALKSSGTYFLRLYSGASVKGNQRDLLREFAFQAK
jgi:hypothetical protein